MHSRSYFDTLLLKFKNLGGHSEAPWYIFKCAPSQDQHYKDTRYASKYWYGTSIYTGSFDDFFVERILWFLCQMSFWPLLKWIRHQDHFLNSILMAFSEAEPNSLQLNYLASDLIFQTHFNHFIKILSLCHTDHKLS